MRARPQIPTIGSAATRASSTDTRPLVPTMNRHSPTGGGRLEDAAGEEAGDEGGAVDHRREDDLVVHEAEKAARGAGRRVLDPGTKAAMLAIATSGMMPAVMGAASTKRARTARAVQDR